MENQSTQDASRSPADPGRSVQRGEGMAGVIERNIRALIAHRKEAESRKPPQDRIADAITGFTGSMTFVYVHVVAFGLWIMVNLGWLPIVPAFDETFVVLAMVASVEAIFLSTFVLISQNRMAALAEKRAELDLQVGLLAEHEVTRLITLTSAIAAKLGIDAAHDPELDELGRDVAPEKVLRKMEQTERDAERTRRAAE
jgi:uncharacterized membrane protein